MPWYQGSNWKPRLLSGLDLLGPERRAFDPVYKVEKLKRPKLPEEVRAALEQETEREQ